MNAERNTQVRNTTAGICSGVTQAGLLSPVDRALYLAVIEKRSLFHPGNWRNPYQGMYQAISQRTLSGGLYYIFQDEMLSIFSSSTSFRQSDVQFLVGLCAGSLNGVILSPISVIKYHGWGTNPNASFVSAARDIMQRGGPRVFFKGVSVSMFRDATFGVVYEVSRGYLRPLMMDQFGSQRAAHFAADMLAASCAGLASAPLNYCRNIIYSVAPNSKPPTVAESLYELLVESRQQQTPWRFLEKRLMVRWSLTRVALGMALGQFIYEQAKATLHILF